MILGPSHPYGYERRLRRLFPLGNWLINWRVLLRCPACGAIRWMIVSDGNKEGLLNRALYVLMVSVVCSITLLIIVLVLLIFASV